MKNTSFQQIPAFLTDQILKNKSRLNILKILYNAFLSIGSEIFDNIYNILKQKYINF